MGYNLKNAGNGKSASKYQSGQVWAPWNETVSLNFRKKIRSFVWEMLLESKVLLSSNIFHTNFFIFLKLQTIIKSHLLMMGPSNLAILIFSTCFFHFWHFMKSRSRDGLAAEGLLFHSRLLDMRLVIVNSLNLLRIFLRVLLLLLFLFLTVFSLQSREPRCKSMFSRFFKKPLQPFITWNGSVLSTEKKCYSNG